MSGNFIFRFRPSILRQLQPLLNSRLISSPSPTSSFLNRNYPASIPKREYFAVPVLPYRGPTGDPEPDLPPAPPNYVVVKSEDEYKTALSKAERESVHTVFYFSSEWARDCEVVTHMLREMAGTYPHVSIFEIDVDEERIANALAPTVQFFRNGKKMDEIVGLHLSGTVIAMKALYELPIDPSHPYDVYRSSPVTYHIDLKDRRPAPSNYVVLKSDKEFSTALNNAEGAEGESVATLFYFSSVLATRGRYMTPLLKEWARKYPHVIVYELAYGEEGTASAMKKLNVTTLPTAVFFKYGKKVGDIIGGSDDED